MEGPSVSIEVVSNGVEPIAMVTTEVVLDENYDCKMVISPFQDREFDFEVLRMWGGR